MTKPLTHKQTAAIAVLLAQPTIADAARVARVSERTLRNWLALPAFRAAFRAAGRQLLESTIGRMQGLAGEALDTLRRNLKSDKPAVEVRAAIGILDQCARAAERSELTEQLDELARRLETLEGMGNTTPRMPHAAT